MPPPINPALQASVDATKVDYVQLGASGLRISVPVLGAMSLGTKKWVPWVEDEDSSVALLKAAYDRGLNTWDTANMYSNGVSEAVIGRALREHAIPRHKVVLMTKCFGGVGETPDVSPAYHPDLAARSKDYVNQTGLSRTAIFHQVNASLERLGTSYVDLLFVHRFDAAVPIEETMRALHDLVQEGKVRYLGASSMWATQFARMQHLAELRGWTRFVSMQNYYNLCYREEEREMNRFCDDTGVGLVAWSPLFAGRLARPPGAADSLRSERPSMHDDGMTPADEEIVRRVERVAEDKGWAMSVVALVWLRHKGVVPIVGFNRAERIDEALEIRGKKLSDEEIKFLEEPYVPKAVQGHK